MRLSYIMNVWADSVDLLKKNIDNISPVVDGIIVVYTEKSNYGNSKEWNVDDYLNEKCFKIKYTPPARQNKAVSWIECDKRNTGLDMARNLGFTHFLMADHDEFYKTDEVAIYKNWIEKNDIQGTVCRLKTYFKSPTLCVGFDHTLVPFIHKITPTLKFELDFRGYPFTWDEDGVHIDPTRRLNISEGVQMVDIVMHHFSWIRSDINLKIENSTARNNLKKSSIYRDWERAAPGVYNEFYRAYLQEVPNEFNL